LRRKQHGCADQYDVKSDPVKTAQSLGNFKQFWRIFDQYCVNLAKNWSKLLPYGQGSKTAVYGFAMRQTPI
jgi:hypothetical protein